MRRALFFLGFAALFCEGPFAAAQTPVERSRPAAADGYVDIENASGSVKVVGWDKNEVAVRGTLGRRAEGLAFSGKGNRTMIEVETAGNPHGVSSDLEVSVPAGSRVRVEGFNANMTVSGVTGSVSVETVNGSITLTGAAKEINLTTVNGAVQVSSSGGRVRTESVNGSVTIRQVKGELDASTVNGPLSVTDVALDRADLEPVSGSVRFQGNLGQRATLAAEAVSGSIELSLPAGISADFDLSSFSGHIETQWGQAEPSRERHSPEKRLTFSTGHGGATITVHTLSGTIRIGKVQ
jgi:DUF4097 and DUF4098 domain-containing protein YvlB